MASRMKGVFKIRELEYLRVKRALGHFFYQKLTWPQARNKLSSQKFACLDPDVNERSTAVFWLVMHTYKWAIKNSTFWLVLQIAPLQMKEENIAFWLVLYTVLRICKLRVLLHPVLCTCLFFSENTSFHLLGFVWTLTLSTQLAVWFAHPWAPTSVSVGRGYREKSLETD